MTSRAVLVGGFVFAAAAGIGVGMVAARSTYPPVDVLLATNATIIGQPIEYPGGEPRITAAIITMQPGQETGLHRHDAPLFAYILSGEIEVDYGPDGTRQYGAGEAFLEAFRSPHNGRALGDQEVRLLAVFMGSAGTDGVENTVMMDQ